MILVVCQPGAVGGIGAFGLLRLVVQSDCDGVALRRAQQGTAVVGGSNVGIVIGIGQVNDRAVIVLGDGERVGALALHLPYGAGLGDVRPIAVVTVGGFGFNDQEASLVALCIIQRAISRAAGGIAAAVGNGVCTILIADDRIPVISAEWNEQLLDRIPLKHGKLGVRRNGLMGLAVDLGNVDLYRPFLVVDGHIGAAVCGYRNLLFAAGAARVGVKAMGNTGLFHREADVRQLAARRCDGRVHRRLGLALQTADGFALGGVGGCIGFFLRIKRPHIPTGAAAGLADRVVHRPMSRSIAASGVVGVIHDMAAGGHRLAAGRRQAPAAAVNAAAGGRGRDLKHCFIDRFSRRQSDLVQVENIA